jgi:hypothetical protein
MHCEVTLVILATSAVVGCGAPSSDATTSGPSQAPKATFERPFDPYAIDGTREVADDLVQALLRCEPNLTCGPVEAIDLRQIEKARKYELLPMRQTVFARNDGSQVRILSETDRKHIVETGGTLFYLGFPLEWRSVDEVTVSVAGAVASRAALERIKAGIATGYACGGGSYDLHREGPGWACGKMPEVTSSEPSERSWDEQKIQAARDLRCLTFQCMREFASDESIYGISQVTFDVSAGTATVAMRSPPGPGPTEPSRAIVDCLNGKVRSIDRAYTQRKGLVITIPMNGAVPARECTVPQR